MLVIGLEPIRDNSQRILSPSCLPISTYEHFWNGLKPLERYYLLLKYISPHFKNDIFSFSQRHIKGAYGQTRTDINRGIKYHFPVITIQALPIKLHAPYESPSCYSTTRARKLFYEFFYLDSLGIAYQFYSSRRTDILNLIAKTHR